MTSLYDRYLVLSLSFKFPSAQGLYSSGEQLVQRRLRASSIIIAGNSLFSGDHEDPDGLMCGPLILDLIGIDGRYDA